MWVAQDYSRFGEGGSGALGLVVTDGCSVCSWAKSNPADSLSSAACKNRLGKDFLFTISEWACPQKPAVFWLTAMHIYCESLRTSSKFDSCEPSSVSWLQNTAEVQNVSLGAGFPRFPENKLHCALVYPIVCAAEGVPLSTPALQLRQCYNLIYFMISILRVWICYFSIM